MKRITVLCLAVLFTVSSCGTTGNTVKEKDGGYVSEQDFTEGITDGKTDGAGDGGKTAMEKLRELKDKGREKPDGLPEPDVMLDNNTVAVIGKYVLTRDKYKIILDYMKERYNYELTDDQEKEFLQFIINKKLMAMEARNSGYADKKEVRVKYEWDFDDIVSHDFYEENVEKRSRVTTSQAREYYNKHKEDFIEIQAQHVLVKNSSLAKNLHKRIIGGEDFETIVKKYSEDETTKSAGGSLGFFSKGVMVKEFEDAAFAMSKGEISMPVKTIYGYHIIKLNDKRKISFDDSKDKIVKMIREKKKQQVFEDMIEKLKSKYNVVINEDIIK